MRRLMIFSTATLVVPGMLVAQTRPAGQRSTRVRLTIVSPKPALTVSNAERLRVVIGDLVSVSNDSVVVVSPLGVSPLMVPTPWIQRFEVSRGRRSRAGRGALVGFVAGGATGVVMAQWICRGTACDSESAAVDVAGVATVAFAGIGVLVGVGVGAVVGAIAKTERWEARPLVGFQTSLTVLPTGALAVSGSIPLRIHRTR